MQRALTAKFDRTCPPAFHEKTYWYLIMLCVNKNTNFRERTKTKYLYATKIACVVAVASDIPQFVE